MGYSTYISGSIEGAETVAIEGMLTLHKEQFSWVEGLEQIFLNGDSVEVRNSDEVVADVVTLSTMLPGAVVSIYGDGESNLDVWHEEYISGGLTCRQYAEEAYHKYYPLFDAVSAFVSEQSPENLEKVKALI